MASKAEINVVAATRPLGSAMTLVSEPAEPWVSTMVTLKSGTLRRRTSLSAYDSW